MKSTILYTFIKFVTGRFMVLNNLGVQECQSRMMRKCHVRFVGEGDTATYALLPDLKHVVGNPSPKPLIIKLDPGSKLTGLAILDGENVIWAAQWEHRAWQIKNALESRRLLRRSRRNRKTRYRQSRFDNRKRPTGWLPPSLIHRVLTIETWVKRLCRYAPITQIAMEWVKFDTQKLQNQEVNGVEDQQGELAGYEVREYLVEKWGRKCSYCDSEGLPLQVEHIHPRSKGGSNQVSNLTLSCERCNIKKGTKPVKEFLTKDPARLEKILQQAKQQLKDAGAVNSIGWALFRTLKNILPITTGTGGQTKYNRTRVKLPQQHWIDAACVGEIETIKLVTQQPLRIKATGWGTRQMCGTDRYGFPSRHRERNQIHFGFRTGDIASSLVTNGKKVGEYVGVYCVVKQAVLILPRDSAGYPALATDFVGQFIKRMVTPMRFRRYRGRLKPLAPEFLSHLKREGIQTSRRLW